MEKLLEYFNEERGRRKRLAEALGISPPAITMWTEVPYERLVDVERITGIKRQHLRPDVFAGMKK